jgi:hypothetical protein
MLKRRPFGARVGMGMPTYAVAGIFIETLSLHQFAAQHALEGQLSIRKSHID